MNFSYSKVNTFEICPRKYKYNYIDKIQKDDMKEANHAGLLGQTLGKMLEHDVKEGVKFYRSHLYCVTEESMVWEEVLEEATLKLRPYIEKGGEFEREINYKVDHNQITGYIDWISLDGKTMYDFKFTSSPRFYEDSPQLLLYEYMLERTTDIRIDYSSYLCVQKPKINYKLNTWVEKKKDMLNQIKESDVIEYQACPKGNPISAWNSFKEAIETIETTWNFPKRTSAICRSCEFAELCKED